MQYEVTVRYDAATIRAAAWRFLVRFVRRDVCVGLVGICIATGIAVFRADLWHIAAMVAGLAVLLIGVVVGGAAFYVRSAAARFRSMADPVVTWRFSDEVLATRSELGTVEVPWRAVRSVWRFPDVWLVSFGGVGYSTLPAAQLGAEVRAFIVAQVQGSGGVVA